MNREAELEGHGDQCAIVTCNASAWSLFEGQTLCFQHYRGRLAECFDAAHGKWAEAQPPNELKYLLGRMYEEFGRVVGPSYLSAARIRNRAFNFQKTADGAEFKITRHLHAWTGKAPLQRVVQRWKVTLATRTFQLLETQPWQDGYPQ